MRDLPICPLDALPDPSSRGFELPTPEGPVECLLVRRGGQVFAYRNRCPHTGAPLDWLPGQFLDLTGEPIQCTLLGALFLPDTGDCVHGPCLGDHLTPVRVALKDGLLADGHFRQVVDLHYCGEREVHLCSALFLKARMRPRRAPK